MTTIRSNRRRSSFFLTFAMLALLALPAAAGEPSAAAPPAASSPPRVAGLLVRVVDLDRAVEFYRDVAGFDAVRVDKDAGRADLVNGELGLSLLKVETPVRHEFPGAVEGHLNLKVEKLDATLVDLERRGVPRLLETPRVAVVGSNMPITDPSGNILYVVEPKNRKDPMPRPQVLNYGITVPDMTEARKFYEGVLGFQVFSEAFYPPSIPFVPSGVIQVVLHHTATRRSEPPSPGTAQMNLILEVEQLDAALQAYEARGGRVRSKGGAALSRPHAELIDPFGNVHLIVERPKALAKESK